MIENASVEQPDVILRSEGWFAIPDVPDYIEKYTHILNFKYTEDFHEIQIYYKFFPLSKN